MDQLLSFCFAIVFYSWQKKPFYFLKMSYVVEIKQSTMYTDVCVFVCVCMCVQDCVNNSPMYFVIRIILVSMFIQKSVRSDCRRFSYAHVIMFLTLIGKNWYFCRLYHQVPYQMVACCREVEMDGLIVQIADGLLCQCLSKYTLER